MTAVPTARHDQHVRFRMVEPVPEDEARDILGKKLVRGPSRFDQHPLLAARYPVDPQANSQPSPDSEGTSRIPEIPTAGIPDTANTYTPLSTKNRGDSSLNDLHIQKGGRPLADDIANQISRHLHSRFDPRFIEFDIDDEQFIDEAVALVQGGNGRKPLFHKYIKELNSAKTENETTPALTAAFNEIAKVLLRQPHKPEIQAEQSLPFFYTGCDKAPQHNPDLRFLPGHGERQVKQDGNRRFSDWNDVRPDILVWKDPKLGGGIDWGRMASMVEVKKAASCDMRTVSERTVDKSLLQLLKYLVSLIQSGSIWNGSNPRLIMPIAIAGFFGVRESGHGQNLWRFSLWTVHEIRNVGQSVLLHDTLVQHGGSGSCKRYCPHSRIPAGTPE